MRVDINEAEGKLSELVGKLQYSGERQVIITKRGVPVARITDYYAEPLKRRTGRAKGKFIIPDDWDAKDAEIAEMFEVSQS